MFKRISANCGQVSPASHIIFAQGFRGTWDIYLGGSAMEKRLRNAGLLWTSPLQTRMSWSLFCRRLTIRFERQDISKHLLFSFQGWAISKDISATARDSAKVSFLRQLFVALRFPIIVCVVCLRITWPPPGLVAAAPDGETQQNYVKNTKDKVLTKARDAGSFRMKFFESSRRTATGLLGFWLHCVISDDL